MMNRSSMVQSQSWESSSLAPCAVNRRRFGSSVQDHQTKGDQPFQALIAQQLQIQPPSPVPATALAPLRGRKGADFL